MVTAISSQLLLQAPRLAMADSQKRLARAQVEVATGRHEDIGLTLGGQTGTVIGLRLHVSELEQRIDSSRQAGLKAEAAQEALTNVNSVAEKFRSTLTGARTAEGGRSLTATFARTALDSLRDSLSTSFDGQYLFGGLSTDRPPLNAYDSGPRQAIVNAFQTEFGFPPDDPAAAGLSVNQLQGFLDGTFKAQFSPAGWTGSWSNATDATPQFRIQSGDYVSLSATANGAFSRSLAEAFSMMEVFGNSKISASAYQATVNKALAVVSDGQLMTAAEQARIGIGEDRLKAAQTALEQRKTTATAAISSLENIDPYEAATRVNQLMTQLEGAYSLTGRISKMSLLSYI